MQNLRVPTLVVFKGLPGTGKSTLAKGLCQQTGWPLVERDIIKEELLRGGTPDSEVGLKSHQAMWQQAEGFIQEGMSCICDTNLNQPVILDDLKEIEKGIRVKILIVECVADEEVMRDRIEVRRDKGLLPFWIDSWEKYQQYKTSEKNQGDFEILYPKLEVNTNHQVDLEEVTRWITE